MSARVPWVDEPQGRRTTGITKSPVASDAPVGVQ